jgi:hypothetical protein
MCGVAVSTPKLDEATYISRVTASYVKPLSGSTESTERTELVNFASFQVTDHIR